MGEDESEAVKKSAATKNHRRNLLITNGRILQFYAFRQFFHSFSGAALAERDLRQYASRC
jgi:hypothetical protein